MKFYLGCPEPSWLWREEFAEVPLFISDARLRRRRTPFPRALTCYAVDSGAFSELSRHGRWTVTPAEYVARLRRYWRELGPFDWAAAQDSMCEPFILAKVAAVTGRRPTVRDHQVATVANYLELRALAPELPIAPTVQGWTLADYLACVLLYADVGVDLAALPLVGVGSVCRRQATSEIEEVFRALAGLGLRLHGFGVKLQGLQRGADLLTSADSMAWSTDARWATGRRRGCCTGPSGCRNCPRFAREWHQHALTAAAA